MSRTAIARIARAAAVLAVVLASSLGTACARGRRPARTETVSGGEVEIASGADVLVNMRRRYAAVLPSSVALLQTNTVYTTSGQVRQQARVLVEPPARMRVDFLPLRARNGALYLEREAITVANGRRTASQTQPSPALLFGYSVYAQAPDSTRRLLEALEIDVRRVRQDTFNGAPVWVIGAPAGDLASNQLWVSTNRLLPLRHIRRERRNGAAIVTDTRFGAYREYEGFPVASTVDVYRNGRLALQQRVTQVKLGVPLPAGTFDRSRWVEVAVTF